MNIFAYLLDWFGRSAEEAERSDREFVLAQAADHAELEMRQRDLERSAGFGMRRW
jgi:hypothetical protein